jgi:hypothetical protein
MRFILIFLAVTFYMSFLYAEESSFKFTFGSNLGSIPFEINKTSKNIRTPTGIKINSWILSPNFSSFIVDKKKLDFLKDNDSKKALYIKFNYKF